MQFVIARTTKLCDNNEKCLQISIISKQLRMLMLAILTKLNLSPTNQEAMMLIAESKSVVETTQGFLASEKVVGLLD